MSTQPALSISNLEELVEGLNPADRVKFDRIYRVSTKEVNLIIPKTMVTWVKQHFRNIETVESQQIVRVINKITGEGTLFNSVRAQRPLQDLQKEPPLDLKFSDDLLASPLEFTPEDPFGRLTNEHGTTAANIAKYDVLHSLVVFKDADPLAFTLQSLSAHLDLAARWIESAHKWDSDACYPYIIWNCLWRAGGSLLHGHIQMALARNMHYSRIERLRADAESYSANMGANYFDDLVATHFALGCAHQINGIKIIAHLTPLRDKEVLLFAPRLDAQTSHAIYSVLKTFRDVLGVRSFNMGIILPPIAPVSESWEGFPAVIRIVDRGSLNNRNSDVAGMELFAESVVASDPFAVAQEISQITSSS